MRRTGAQPRRSGRGGYLLAPLELTWIYFLSLIVLGISGCDRPPPAHTDGSAGGSGSDQAAFREAAPGTSPEGLESSENWTARGDVARSEGRLDDSETSYQTALAADPDHLPALKALVDLYQDTDRTTEARQFTARAHGVAPADPQVLHWMGKWASLDGDASKAIEFYERSLAEAETAALSIDPQLHHDLGEAYSNQGRFPKAMEHFRFAIASGRAPVESYLGMGDVYARQGRSAEAIAQYQQAVARDQTGPLVPSIEAKIAEQREKLKNDAFRPR